MKKWKLIVAGKKMKWKEKGNFCFNKVNKKGRLLTELINLPHIKHIDVKFYTYNYIDEANYSIDDDEIWPASTNWEYKFL